MQKFNEAIKAMDAAQQQVNELSASLTLAESTLLDAVKQAFEAFPYDELAKLKAEQSKHDSAQTKALDEQASKQIFEHSQLDVFKSNIIAIRGFLASLKHTEVGKLFISEQQGGLGAINGLAFWRHVATNDEKQKIDGGLRMTGNASVTDAQRLGLQSKAFSNTKQARISELEAFLSCSVVAPLIAEREVLQAADELKRLNADNSSLIAKCNLKKAPALGSMDEVIIVNTTSNDVDFYGFNVPANGQEKVKPINYQIQTCSESMFSPRREEQFKVYLVKVLM
ncbi:hypothetical protein [Vibrio sonorensis]|uniref:hypothetical protein n=1 Tax=Vibrio sonorensis TaxID=1004316 RepID=UPI0008DA4EB0|nr:hypothetical protein [Vibrio sonorensis]